MSNEKSWILVVDGAQARFFQGGPRKRKLTELQALRMDGARETGRDIDSDKSGRSFDSVGAGRHAMQAQTDSRQEQERVFVKRVAACLDEQFEHFDELTVVAAPKALGDLRKSLSPGVQKKVRSELNKDLTNSPVDKIAEQVLGSP